MRKSPASAVEKQKPRHCLWWQEKHKSDGKKQENVLKNKNINVTYISIFFEFKSHTTVTKAISMIDSYLENKKLLENSDNEYKRKFFLFFYRFQMIFNKKKNISVEIN